MGEATNEIEHWESIRRLRPSEGLCESGLVNNMSSMLRQTEESQMTDAVDSTGSPSRSAALFVVNGLGIGGSERKTVTIVNELHRSGWNVHLAYLTDRTAGLDRLDKGVPLVYLRRKGRFSLTASINLRRAIKSIGATKVVCVNLYPLLYVTLAARVNGAARRPSVLLLINTTRLVGWKENLQMILYRPLIRRVESIVFGCHSQLDLWRSKYHLDESRCTVIYNGIDESRFVRGDPQAGVDGASLSTDVKGSDFVVGAIGQLRAVKNHRELLLVMDRLGKRIPGIRMVIAGHGPERSQLDRLARVSAYSDRIVLLGQVADVRPFLERLDVFVLPSLSETFSNAVLEAMAMEVPVIITDTGGAREMVQDGVDGFIYKQGDLDSLAMRVEQLVDNGDLRSTIGRKARETVLRRFTFATMIREYEKLLQ